MSSITWTNASRSGRWCSCEMPSACKNSCRSVPIERKHLPPSRIFCLPPFMPIQSEAHFGLLNNKCKTMLNNKSANVVHNNAGNNKRQIGNFIRLQATVVANVFLVLIATISRFHFQTRTRSLCLLVKTLKTLIERDPFSRSY